MTSFVTHLIEHVVQGVHHRSCGNLLRRFFLHLATRRDRRRPHVLQEFPSRNTEGPRASQVSHGGTDGELKLFLFLESSFRGIMHTYVKKGGAVGQESSHHHQSSVAW